MRLSVRSLAKAYAAPVLKAIDFDVAQGEIRALIGENGAGKSTFFNVLAGLVPRDGGAIAIDGADYRPGGIRYALRHGIAIQTQELSLIETLSVAENLRLRTLPAKAGWIDRAALDRAAEDIIDLLGLTGVTPDMAVGALPLAERQMLEFGKALAHPASILILDEPTAALSVQQAERLHAVMRARADQGTSILYASHRLEDVRAVCDTVSIMRDGQIVTTAPAASMTASQMIEAMSGRTLSSLRPAQAVRADGAILLQADAITTRDLPHPLSLTLRAGEIVGLAGLAGAGRTEVIEALFGLSPLLSGEVIVAANGERQSVTSASRAVALGIGLVTEDRKRSGIFAGQDIAFNAAIASTGGRRTIDKMAERASVAKIISLLGIRCSGPDQDIASLSGGNQQKVLFGRWLIAGSRILLLDEPGRGVDVAAKHDIYAEAIRLAEAGGTVLVASSELEELTALCDRIVVLSARRAVATFDGPDWNEQAILAAAFAGHVDRTLPEASVNP
ncbi:MAG: sugar ABC transporter ATP-binding protein [Sphingobium sp.]